MWQSIARVLTGYGGAAMLLILHFVVVVWAGLDKCCTWDEPGFIAAGLSYWTDNDYRLDPENGNFPQRLFGLPLWLQGIQLPHPEAAWPKGLVWPVGTQLLFESGHTSAQVVLPGRCLNALLSVAMGLLVYAWSRRLFGAVGATLSLLLYISNPTIIANGGLATADTSAALFFIASVGAAWRLCQRIDWLNLTLVWLSLAGLFLSKMSATIAVAVALLLVGIQVMTPRHLPIGLPKTVLRGRLGRAGALTLSFLLCGLAVIATIWLFYGMRYSAFAEAYKGHSEFWCTWESNFADIGFAGQFVQWARGCRLLPEAYLFGAASALHHSLLRGAFLNGAHSNTGWWYFFPYTFLVKTPLAAFAMVCLAAGAAWVHCRNLAAKHGWLRTLWLGFYATAPLWLLLILYWTAAVNSRLNIGHRHVLLTYPAMFILCGAVVYWSEAGPMLRRAGVGLIAALLTIAVLDCVLTFPNYLTYFNALAGGPSNGYKHLVDSSLDWGQDLPGLKQWLLDHDLDGNPQVHCYQAYFGSVPRSYYHLRTEPVNEGTSPLSLAPLQDGFYFVSATEVERAYDPIAGHWCEPYEKQYKQLHPLWQQFVASSPEQRAQVLKRDGEAIWQTIIVQHAQLRWARLCAYMRHRTPDDMINYSILVYKLSAKEINDALEGPPAELPALPRP